MTNIYACLCGKWVNLCDDEKCVMGNHMTSPRVWWEENASIYAPTTRAPKLVDSYYALDYLHIFYKGKDYRINPIFIQIVNEQLFPHVPHR